MILENGWIAALIGIVIAGVSAVIAWLGLRWSGTRPHAMMIAVLGGTMIRLLLVSGVSVLLLLSTPIHVTGYAVGLIVAYLVFLGVEVVLVARASDQKKAAASAP